VRVRIRSRARARARARVSGQHVRRRREVVLRRLLLQTLAQQGALRTLEVLDHAVLACELIVVAEVVYSLVLVQPDVVEILADPP
jgi:hypothetical protein